MSLYGDEIYTWGRFNPHANQGWAIRGLDRRYFAVAWSELFDTHERDGKILFDGKVWKSEGGRTVSYPRSVVDGYGELVPV